MAGAMRRICLFQKAALLSDLLIFVLLRYTSFFSQSLPLAIIINLSCSLACLLSFFLARLLSFVLAFLLSWDKHVPWICMSQAMSIIKPKHCCAVAMAVCVQYSFYVNMVCLNFNELCAEEDRMKLQLLIPWIGWEMILGEKSHWKKWYSVAFWRSWGMN